MKISVITPTADRPAGFSLCERFMARQTVQPDEWIVADGGVSSATCAMGQMHLTLPAPPGPANFANNLLYGLSYARGDIIVWIEDDDWYAPNHIEAMVAALDAPFALIAGRHEQPYYHVGARRWRMMGNNRTHSSLCQTAMRRGAIPVFESVVRDCLDTRKFYVDVGFWKCIATAQWAIAAGQTCIGIKGLPGQAGLGIGHQPEGNKWAPDPELAKLREWIGSDAELYAGFRADGARLKRSTG